MNLWIVTIGSSDVQLDSDETNQAKGRTEKQRSDKVWSYWYTDDLKAQYHDISFEPKPIFKDREEAYRIAPRILGAVYTASSESVQQEIWDYLTFPLLDNFVQALAGYPAPEAIAVLLTEQSAIFPSDRQRQSKSPYWQDTCELKPILQRYFTDRFPGVPWEFVFLKPESQAESLDNWNAVLELVRNQFRTLKIEAKAIQIAPDEFVYVSHQAGTPAISSAVQFCSLAQFGDRVKFLVSSEQDKTLTDTVESSAYLQGIEIQQVKKLLYWHDYAGIKEVLKRQIEEVEKQNGNPKRTNEQRKRDEQLKHVAYLLDAAIHWNCANFESFAEELKKHPDQEFVQIVEERTKVIGEQTKQQQKGKKLNYYNYWWTAYEDAYLGVVRLNQNNTVEAMFHSFRAVEGLLSEWINKHYKHLMQDGEIHLPKPIKIKRRKKEEEITTAKPYGQGLYFALDSIKDISKKDNLDIWIFGNCTFRHRNSLFHGLEGLADKKEVFRKWQPDNDEKRWGDNDNKKWKMRVLNCLNFIVKDDLPKKFELLEEASLMVRVHEELVSAIAHL